MTTWPRSGDEFGFDDERLAGLARNSFDACFAPGARTSARWQAEVDAWLADRSQQASEPSEASRPASQLAE